MKAISFRVAADSQYLKDFSWDIAMPKIACPECKTEQFELGAPWFPCARLAPAADRTLFSDECVVSPDEFHDMAKRVRGLGPHHHLRGTSPLGPVRIKPRKGATMDVLACSLTGYLISKRACNLLAGQGIDLETGPVVGRDGAPDAFYVALQTPVLPLYTARMMDLLSFVRCGTCSHIRLVNLRTNLMCPREYTLPDFESTGHLLRPEEGRPLLASPRFVEVVRELKLRGIQFEECGDYV